MRDKRFAIVIAAIVLCGHLLLSQVHARSKTAWRTVEVPFKSHDGYPMFGKLILPPSGPTRAVVMYVQTAEGATVDQKRKFGNMKTFSYFDIYREQLIPKNIGFFSYEGRGIFMGDEPPRFETIDPNVYNTSTLDNKVKDALSAIAVLRQQPGCKDVPLLLIGASEGTLLATETASRQPDQIAGLVLYGVMATGLRETFEYMMSDGAFMQLCDAFDTNRDGKITEKEYEADARKFRKNNGLQNTSFSELDPDKDELITVADMRIFKKPIIDATLNDDFDTLRAWSHTGAALAVPENWFEDHFAHETMWTFLSVLDIPVGCFHGVKDLNAPVSAVRALEEKAKQAGKDKVEFHYFKYAEHTLLVSGYFFDGKIRPGHRRIFAFIDRVVKDAESKK